jgi:hypothetical protein
MPWRTAAVFYRKPLQLSRGARWAVEIAFAATMAALLSYLILHTR